jgi:hypothetical protein
MMVQLAPRLSKTVRSVKPSGCDVSSRRFDLSLILINSLSVTKCQRNKQGSDKKMQDLRG